MEKFIESRIARSLLWFLLVLSVSISCSFDSGKSSGSSASITPTPVPASLGATPTSGVAPLAVHFDATDVTSPTTTRPFHDLEYRWNFGDAEVPWTQGANPAGSSKNRATGAVSAHVYEAPGTYKATLTIVDGTNTTTRIYNVTVDNPDDVFATKTTCISTDGDFTGAPSGAKKVTASNFNVAATAALNSGSRRILFKRGQTFDLTDSTFVTQTDPVIIGAFGSGVRPKLLRSSSNTAPLVAVNYDAKGDMRFMDFEVDGANLIGNPLRAFNVGTEAEKFLALRIYGHDMSYLCSTAGFYTSVVDCEMKNVIGGQGNYGIWSQDTFYHFYAGNLIDDGNGGEYCQRVQGGQKTVISHNTYRRCGDHKAIFVIRGDGSGSAIPRYVTEKMVFTDCFVDGEGSLPNVGTFAISPTNSTRLEMINDIIVERSVFTTATTIGLALEFGAQDITVRNNLIRSVGTGADSAIVHVNGTDTPGMRQSARINLFNNTMFISSTNKRVGMIISGLFGVANSEPFDCQFVNNFVYTTAPPTWGDFYVVKDGGIRTIVAGNTPDASHAATPNFVVNPPVAIDDWKLVSGSYAKGAGVAARVYSDFYGTPRTGAMDIGAAVIP